MKTFKVERVVESVYVYVVQAETPEEAARLAGELDVNGETSDYEERDMGLGAPVEVAQEV